MDKKNDDFQTITITTTDNTSISDGKWILPAGSSTAPAPIWTTIGDDYCGSSTTFGEEVWGSTTVRSEEDIITETLMKVKQLNAMTEEEILSMIIDDENVIQYIIHPTEAMEAAHNYAHIL